MKSNATQVTQSGNVNRAKSRKMTINSAATGKLMGLFSNQYSNKDLAVLREYFCNGDDARIAAGSTRPTEVYLPTDIQPSLIIRDFGPGLDEEGFYSTGFAEYGLSTKDEENESTGHFGIGSKAAFTMGPQFTATGYKDGVMTTILLSLDNKGVGEVTVTHVGPTTEPNGVLISLSVPDVESMLHNAEVFFSTVPKGRVLVDGEEPVHLFDREETARVNDEAVLVKDGEGEIKVSMGPVVYPITKDILRKVSKRLEGTDAHAVAEAMLYWGSTDSLYLDVPMGDLTLAPSREDLRDTDDTLDTLASVITGVAQTLIGGIQAKVDGARSYYEAALILHREMTTLKAFKVSHTSFTYGKSGKSFTREVTLNLPVFSLVKKTWRSETKIVGREDKFTVDFARADKTLVVAGVPKDDTSKVSRYAKRFLEESPGGYEYIVVSEETKGEEGWFQYGTKTGAVTMDLAEYRAALRALRDSNPRTRTEPSYTTGFETASRDLDDRDLLTDIISWGKDIVVFHESANVSQYVRKVLEDYTIVVLLAQQSENMLRKRVEADGTVKVIDTPYLDLVRKQAEEDFKTVTDAELEALGAIDWLESKKYALAEWTELAKVLGRENITNKVFLDVLDTIEIAELTAEGVTPERRKTLRVLSQYVSAEVKPAAFEAEVPAFGAAYPLLNRVSSIGYYSKNSDTLRDDVLAYLNAR